MSQSQFIRKAQPDCLRYFLGVMRATDGGERTATIDQLVAVLTKQSNYEKSTATETVTNAIRDGLLIPLQSSPQSSAQRARSQEPKVVRLPKDNEITYSTHDCYCFECHLPGMLEHCSQCIRSFHRLCHRKDAERPNYSVPSAKLQKNRLPAFSSDTDSSDIDGNVSTPHGSAMVAEYESDLRASSSLLLDQTSLAGCTPPQRLVEERMLDNASSPMPVYQQLNSTTAVEPGFEGKPNVEDFAADIENESKTKADVVYLGEVRPPMRKRPATTASSMSYKSEISPADDEEHDMELCTCCRLLKSAALRNPPNMQPDEMCYLLDFTFERNRTWMGTDIPAFMEYMKLNTQEQDIISQLLFKIPEQRLDKIAQRLQQQQYKFLMEFLVDILDFQHSIGVFFGYHSTEMESTKWLVRDITHDLSEIRRCPDCFRYSHEKGSSAWFAKPCVQRHELVFAKHSGFCYWPAKVIRVLPNNKHDVRFFGGDHSRALIDVRFIRPIDTDIKSLKLGNTPTMKKAMEELRYHQVLSTYPPSKFSFHANKQETEQIIRHVLDMDLGGTGRGRRRGRRSKRSGTELQLMCVDLLEDNNNTTANSILSNHSYREQAVNTPNSIIEFSFDSEQHEAPVAETTQAKRRRGRNGTVNSTQSKRVTRSLQNSINPNDVKEILADLERTTEIAKVNQLKNDKLLAQVKKLKETIKKHECEKRIVKRKQWCYWCLNEAIYLCCFRAAYCSEVCQSRHWKDGHNKVCKNQDLEGSNRDTNASS